MSITGAYICFMMAWIVITGYTGYFWLYALVWTILKRKEKERKQS